MNIIFKRKVYILRWVFASKQEYYDCCKKFIQLTIKPMMKKIIFLGRVGMQQMMIDEDDSIISCKVRFV